MVICGSNTKQNNTHSVIRNIFRAQDQGFTIVNNLIQHRGLDSRGTIYLSKTEIMWGDAHHIHQETMCEFQSNFSGGPFTFEKLNLFHIK